MQYAIIKDQSVELLNGQSFTLPATDNPEDFIQYPGNVINLWTEEELEAIGVYPIPDPASPPEGQIEQSRHPAIENGRPVWNVVYVSTPAPTVPTKVHKFWLIRVLETLGEMDDIEDVMHAAWEAGNRSLKRSWDAATEIERANQLVNEFAELRGKTSQQVDAMFIQAAALQAANTTA